MYVLVYLLQQTDVQSSEHFPVLPPELVKASQKLGEREKSLSPCLVELDASSSALLMRGKGEDGYHQASSATRTTWKQLHFLKGDLCG